MDIKAIEVFAGVLMPVVIDLVNKNVANSQVRYLIALALCLALGVVFNLNQLNPADALASGAIVFASAQTAYKTYYEKSQVRKLLLD